MTQPEQPCPHGYIKGDHHWWGCMGVSPFSETEPTSMSEKEYKDFLKTMLAEFIADQTDPIFTSERRKDLEEECLSLGMSLPLVRVIPNEA